VALRSVPIPNTRSAAAAAIQIGVEIRPDISPPARNARSPRENARKISLQQLHPQCAANSAIRAFDCDQIATPEPATNGAPRGVGYLIEGTALVRFAGAERQQFTGREVPARSTHSQ
jgi:hypothetical protein